MLARRCLSIIALLATMTLIAQAQEKPNLDGKWLLYYGGLPITQQRLAILKIETEGGKPTIKVEANPEAGLQSEVSKLKIEGTKLSFNVDLGPNKLSFEGTIDPKNPKIILGNFGDSDRLFRAAIERTDLEKLERKDMIYMAKSPPKMLEVGKLRSAPAALRVKARQEKDKEEKAKLTKEADELQKVNDAKIPDVYREVIKEGAESPFATLAAETLLTMASKAKATPEEVKSWVKMAETEGMKYGARFEQTAMTQLARNLSTQPEYAAIALPYAEKAASYPKMTTKNRVAALKILAVVQTSAGKTELAKKTEAELAKLDAQLDAEYLATVPPFKPTKYEGRTDKSANKVAVMELFTGAQCPPCVAADVGFDGLLKAYKPQDVILIQYHLHIPGPDPLTNKETVARSQYYNKVVEGSIRGTPSTLFNGKPQAGGGGGMANSEKKFDAYREIINKTLESSSDVKLAGSFKRAGDELSVTVDVAGMKDPKKDLKLRLILLEDNIRYVGGNGLRFHHHVVRSFLGTMDGIPVADLKNGKHSVKQSVKALQADLKSYLDTYNATSPFPYPDRPLDLKGLKVVALIQDDSTGEILQAIQLDAPGA